MTDNNKDNVNNIIYDTENSLVFDDYLDLLLNKGKAFHNLKIKPHDIKVDGKGSFEWENATKLEQYEYIHYPHTKKILGCKPNEESLVYTGGLKLPKHDDHANSDSHEGSGNIVILGNPGAGKSTLAFQIAAACISDINKGIAVYYSLEVTPKNMIDNMLYKDGKIKTKTWFYLPGKSEYDELSSSSLYKRLREVLKGGLKGEKIEPQILFPAMSPRGLAGSGEPHRLFVDRYTELELMHKAIKKYNDEAVKENEPLIKVVVLDSINAFGDCPLSREELYRLFDLFRQYGILGVFTLENSDTKSENENQFTSEMVKYMSDVVLSLEKDIFNNYTCLYLEVEKSRYVPQVIGKHPYKIAGLGEDIHNELKLRKRVEISPSLHYRIFASEAKSADHAHPVNSEKENLFGIPNLSPVLPNHFENRSMKIPQIITILGNSGIYKSDIAFNALFAGILLPDSENGLIIRMNDRSLFSLNGMRLNTEILDKLLNVKGAIEYEEKEGKGKVVLYEKDIADEMSRSEHKYSSKGWSLRNNANEDPQLIEIAFKSGALLPEEFIEETCRIINRFNIKRVAFTDIKAIGVSYPFLINSKTSGSIFLSAFVHLMRNYGVHVIMSCSSSDLATSDDELHKAGILSDAVVTVRQDGNEMISIVGEGTVTNHNKVTIGLSTSADFKDAEGLEEKHKKKYCFCFVQDESRKQNFYKSLPELPNETNALFPFFINADDNEQT